MTSEEQRLPKIKSKVKIAASSEEKKKKLEKTAKQVNAVSPTLFRPHLEKHFLVDSRGARVVKLYPIPIQLS
jgi:hypothetical protein